MIKSKKIISTYFSNTQKIITSLDMIQINKLVEIIDKVRKNSKILYIAGNGGSASTASHFAADLGVGSLARANPVKAISLCDNLSVITAISNDFEYELIFEKQLKLLGEAGDLLIVISASGNSKNLVQAIKVAQAMGITIFSLTGFDGGKVKKITSDNNIHIPTSIGEYGLVEDTHLAICHVVTECIRAQ